jgi:hypothetical protein
MEEWNAEIDKLAARADRAGEDVQIEYYEQLQRPRALQEEARTWTGSTWRAMPP